MVIFNVLLCLLLCGLILYVFFLKRQIKRLAGQVKTMSADSKKGSRFFVDFREKNLIALVDELNQMVNTYESEKVQVKQAEENLQLSITGLSHDLRTPLTAIDGYVQLLKLTDDPLKKKQYLDVIELSVSKLLEMTNQFYDLTRIDLNQKGFDLVKISLNDTIQDNFLNFFDSFEKSGLTIKFPENSESIHVLADKVLLNRVIQNIIQNILRYAQGKVEIEYAKQGNFGVVTFINDIKSGSKISIEKVFDRFYTESKTRTNSESSGLGLYISKRLIENMNGNMDAKLVQQQFSIEIKLPYI